MGNIYHQDNSIYLIGFALFTLIIVLSNFFVLRWIFSVGRHLRKQDVIIKTLLLIVKQNGATEEELKYLHGEHHKSYKGEL